MGTRAADIKYRNSPHGKEANRVRNRAWYEANKSKVKLRDKRRRLEKNYGITLEERDAILLSQGSRCKICRTDDPGKTGWCVDHCHNTDHIRGILCSSCNLALGFVKDTPAILRAMIRYLYDS